MTRAPAGLAFAASKGTAVTCDACGADVDPDHRFCRGCGSPTGRGGDAGPVRPEDEQAPARAGTDAGRIDVGASVASVAAGDAMAVGADDAPTVAIPPTALSNCAGCGAQNSARRRECGRCGRPLHLAAAAVTGFHDPMGVLGPPAEPDVVDADPDGGRRRAVAWTVVGVAVVALVGAAVALGGLGPFDQPDAPVVDALAGFDPATYDGPPERVDVETMTATSEHEPIGDNRYDVALVLDGDLATAWNSDGDVLPDGVGEVVTIELARPAWLTRMVVANGYQKSAAAYENNARVTRLRMELDGASFDVDLLDRPGRQVVEFDEPRLTTRIRLEVVGAAPGSTYRDLAVSELELYGHPAVAEDVARAVIQRSARDEQRREARARSSG